MSCLERCPQFRDVVPLYYVLKATPTIPQADLVVNGECVAEYKGEPLRTAGGVVKVRTLTSAGIK